MKRYPFLDWLRGLAVLIMIQCHAFNSFARMDLRDGGPYILSQFVGGMAAPLFLFMAGMTLAFGMERSGQRWIASLRRGAWVLGAAYLFRFSNFLFGMPRVDWHELAKVDILNCMGVSMILFSFCALAPPEWRVRLAAGGALAISATAPLVSGLDWNGVPAHIHDYLAPPNGAGRFPIFPYGSFVGFGLAIGIVLKHTEAERVDRLMQWSVMAGITLVLSGQYFANIPFSLYQHSSFWSDSPSLVLIRLGVALVLLAAAYVWTAYRGAVGWSWMETLGRNSLMVYWVHVMLVYSDILKRLKVALSIPQTAVATAIVVALMVVLSVVWLQWKVRRRATLAAPVSASTYSPGVLPGKVP